jgi:hypothetical protein
MPSALRSAAVFAFLSAVVVVSMPGCSQQGEGERCDQAANGDADCNDGLTCVASDNLLEMTADRCCPAAGTETDARCKLRSTGPTNNGGSSGSGGTAGSSSNTAGAPAGGEGGMSSAAGSGGTGGAPVVPGEAGMSNGGTPATPTDGGSSGAGTDTAGVGGA